MSVRPKIMVYLTEHIGETVHVETIMSDLGLERSQVQQGMLYFSTRGLVETILGGNSWRYRPEPEEPVEPVTAPAVTAVAASPIVIGQTVQYVRAPGDLFEVVNVLKNGKLLLQDDQGELFVARKLET